MMIIDQSEVILNLLFSVNSTVIHHICADLSILKIKKKQLRVQYQLFLKCQSRSGPPFIYDS